MAKGKQFHVHGADWARDAEKIRSIRQQVFVHEQGVPPELEWDGMDERCAHVLATDSASRHVVGTGRLLPDGHIGRMAVLAKFRGQGVGAKILQSLVEEALGRAYSPIQLHAQAHAVEFYRRYGFKSQGEKFMEAGIPHFLMVYDVNSAL